MESPNLLRILIKGATVTFPSFLPTKGWSLARKGYVIYTSRRKDSDIKRGSRIHRLVIERLLGRALDPSFQVHHQDFNKLNNDPLNLIYMQSCFNPTGAMRDPYTGEFLSPDTYRRRYEVNYECLKETA